MIKIRLTKFKKRCTSRNNDVCITQEGLLCADLEVQGDSIECVLIYKGIDVHSNQEHKKNVGWSTH